MGIVWEATDELLARRVAVKELRARPGGVLDEARARVLREARLAARLQHPHAISVFDVVLHDDRPWLVMEYLRAVSLAQVLGERGSLPPRDVAAIGSQIADALAASHDAGIVHRDIKPGNVLITTDGQVKITDFGISHSMDDVLVTGTGLIVGTPAYLAPEIVRGESSTAASDVFALGATLYAAVEGQPPFGLCEDAYEVLRRVVRGTVNPPSSAGPLTIVLMQLLQHSPHARPSAAQVRDQLQLIAEQTDKVAAPARTTIRTPTVTIDRTTFPPPRARPARLALGAALVTLVLFLLIGVSLSIVSLGSLSGSPQAAADGNPSTAPQRSRRSRDPPRLRRWPIRQVDRLPARSPHDRRRRRPPWPWLPRPHRRRLRTPRAAPTDRPERQRARRLKRAPPRRSPRRRTTSAAPSPCRGQGMMFDAAAPGNPNIAGAGIRHVAVP